MEISCKVPDSATVVSISYVYVDECGRKLIGFLDYDTKTGGEKVSLFSTADGIISTDNG